MLKTLCIYCPSFFLKVPLTNVAAINYGLGGLTIFFGVTVKFRIENIEYRTMDPASTLGGPDADRS